MCFNKSSRGILCSNLRTTALFLAVGTGKNSRRVWAGSPLGKALFISNSLLWVCNKDDVQLTTRQTSPLVSLSAEQGSTEGNPHRRHGCHDTKRLKRKPVWPKRSPGNLGKARRPWTTRTPCSQSQQNHTACRRASLSHRLQKENYVKKQIFYSSIF